MELYDYPRADSTPNIYEEPRCSSSANNGGQPEVQGSACAGAEGSPGYEGENESGRMLLAEPSASRSGDMGKCRDQSVTLNSEYIHCHFISKQTNLIPCVFDKFMFRQRGCC